MTRIRDQRLADVALLALLRPHRLAVILFWRVLGKRVRARGRLEAALVGLPLAMERIMAREGQADLETLTSGEPQEAALCVHLHISVADDPRQIGRAIKALARQSRKPHRVYVTGDRSKTSHLESHENLVLLEGYFASRFEAFEAALQQAYADGGEWLVPCTASQTLPSHALAAFGARVVGLSDDASVDIIFGDTREEGRGAFSAFKRRYWLKPKWDPRMSLSQDYVTQGCAVRTQAALRALEQAEGQRLHSIYDLALAISDTGRVEHIERVVAQGEPDSWRRDDPERLSAVQRVIGARGGVAAGPFGTTRVQWSLPPTLPTVSVIIATRDRVELLRTCVEGVLGATNYPALDVIIADNESVETETLDYMDKVSLDPRVQVVRWPHPFNYSAINNFAARHAKGEYLCLLNNDIEVIEPQWLTEMMREAVQPGVGAVGARLLYPDRSIQHAGVAIGIGNAAGHAHRGLPEGEPGYYAQALIARGASAVTAACLVVRKDHFDAVGGLDEEGLAVAYNDVDLCLKLQDQGLKNIYTPMATLIHHESKSRGLDFSPEHLERYMRELAVFQERWGTKRVVDPWHHRLLPRGEEAYSTDEK